MTFEQAVLFLEKSSSPKKQHTSKKRVVSRHKKVRSDSTDLVVGASITCIQCGANITSPQTESGNECPVCKTINVIFACPECMGYTQSKSDVEGVTCSHCRSWYRVFVCPECLAVTISAKRILQCTQCGKFAMTLLSGNTNAWVLPVVMLSLMRSMISARLVQHVKVSEYYDEMREIYGDSESFETLWKDLDPVQDDILAYLCTQHCSRQDMLVLLHQIIRVLSKKSSIGNAASWIDFLNQWFQKTGLTPDIINAFISEYFVILTTENLGASGTTWSSIPDELVKYYMLLGLEASANRDDLKKAWRAAAKKYHPDVSGPDHANRMQFMAMNEAWEVLEKNIH